MPARKLRKALGTPMPAATEPSKEAAGIIETTDVVVIDAEFPVHAADADLEPAVIVQADLEPAVIVQIDEAWLDFIELTDEATND